MRVDQALVDLLSNYFVHRSKPNTINATLRPGTDSAINLGSDGRRFATIYADTLNATSIVGEVTGNADTVDDIHAAASPTANYLLALDGDSTFPTSVYDEALLIDGSRALTGNLSVDPGVTIDGIDISSLGGATYILVSNDPGLTNDRALAAGNGLSLTDNGAGSTIEVYLDTPGTLDVDSTNAATADSHTHEITSSSNPGSNDSILQTNASGYLQLARLGINTAPSYLLHVDGDAYFENSNVGIGAIPDGSYALKVAGEVYIDIGDVFIEDGDLGVGVTPSYRLHVNGDAYFASSNVGINTTPSASYALYVSGDTYFTSANVGINVAPDASYSLYSSGDVYLTSANVGVNIAPSASYSMYISGDTYFTSGYVGINVAPNSSYRLRVDGDTYFSTGEVGVGVAPESTKRLIVDGSGGLTYSLYTQYGIAQLGNETRIAYSDAIYTSLVTDSDGNITIAPTGTNIEIDGVAIGTDHFVSQLTGWEVDYDGNADFRYIYADEMHVKAFIADIYEALVGAIIVTKSRAKLSRDYTIPFGAPIVGVNSDDVSSEPITGVNTTSDFFMMDGNLTSYINVGDKFTVAGSTGNDGVYTVQSDSYAYPNTYVYVVEEIPSSTPDGSITFHHYFSIDGDHTSDSSIVATDTVYVNNSTGNDGTYTASSVSYDSGNDETDIYPTTAIPVLTVDGSIGKRSTIYFQDHEGYEETSVFSDDDFLLLRVIDHTGGGLIVTNAWGLVDTYTNLDNGEQSWNFTALRTSSAFAADAVIYTGAIGLDYGQSGDGVWEATVLDTNSPYSQVTTWTTDPWTPGNFTVHTREGNLDGLAGIGAEFGLWAGTGLTTTDSWIKITDTNADLYNIDLEIHDGSNTVIKLDHTTPYIALGAPAPSTYFGTVNGIWMGLNGGAYKVQIGNYNDTALGWDGTDLYLYSDKSSGDYIKASGTGIEFFAGNTERIKMLANGDIFIGQDISDVTTTAIAIFSNNQTYNSESVQAGDILYGDNSSDTPNMFWDAGTSQLQFRTADTIRFYIDSTGKISSYNDYVWLNQTGFNVAMAGVAIDDGRAYKFYRTTDTTTYSGLYNTFSVGVAHSIRMIANDVSGYDSSAWVISNSTTDTATVQLEADGNGYQLDFLLKSASAQSYVLLNTSTANVFFNLGSSGKMLVGNGTYTNSIKGTFHVYSGDAGYTVTPHSYIDDLIIESTAQAGITFAVGSASSAYIDVVDSTTNSELSIKFDKSLEQISFRTATTYRAYIDSAGLTITQDILGKSGAWIGPNAGAAGDGYVIADTGYVLYKNSIYEYGRLFVPLTTPYTSSTYNGSGKSDTTTTLTRSHWSTSIPAGARAILMEITCRDSATAPYTGDDLYVCVGPAAGTYYALAARPIGSDIYASAFGPVPCGSANGDCYLAINASGTGTMDTTLRVWGYWM